MIYPRLDKVRNGQRMSVELVNGLIKRTEYAADLLRQYKPLAGTDISVAQRYDGTTISGGGAVEEVSTFRIIDSSGQIYLPTIEENVSLVPNKLAGDDYYGIAGDVYFGYTMLASAPFSRGIITVGEERREILFGDYTRFYGGDESFAVGETYTEGNDGGETSVFGVKCNLDGSGAQLIIHPKTVPYGEYRNQNVFLSDIYQGNIVGSAITRNTTGQVFSGSFLRTSAGAFINISDGPMKIYGDYITLLGGRLYQISTSQTTTILYNGQSTRLKGIYKNFVSGDTAGLNFLYNIDDGTFTETYGAGEDMG